MDQELNIPKGAQILREHRVEPFASMMLGNCVGHLIDCGLNDLEVLTVVEELLKVRAMVNNPAMAALLEKQMEMAKKMFGEDH